MKKSFYVCFFVLVFLIILTMYIFSDYSTKKILKNPKFTIGKVTSDWHSKETFKSFGIDYSYNVRNHSFTNVSSSKIVLKNNYYLIIYDSLKPNNSEILPMYQIFQKIISPKNGWKYNQVPFKIDTAKIRKHVLDLD